MAFRLRWPVASGTRTQGFMERPEFYKKFGLPGHEGIDIAAPEGAEVRACADGTVYRVELDATKHAYGIYVRLEHETGYKTIYGHLSAALVAEGQQVKAGDLIGRVGSTGNSTGPHLHLTLKQAGATAAGITNFPSDIIDPTPFLETAAGDTAAPARWKPDHPMRGVHGDGAADWMLREGVRGWATETVYNGGDLGVFHPVDYSAHEAAGVRVIVRWGYSFAKADGGMGTFPERARYPEFINWCVQSIRGSRGVWGHIIGNEPNRAGERPDYQGPENPGTPIMPGDITYIYNAVWNQLGMSIRVSPPAIDPTNVETMIPSDYWRAILNDLAGAEFFALHGYSYTRAQPPNSPERFADPSMSWQFRSFRMWEPLAKALFDMERFRHLPILITETNHLFLSDGVTKGWEPDADSWVRAMYQYVFDWNRGPGDQYVHGVCLYRYEGDEWRIADKPALLQALRESGETAV